MQVAGRPSGQRRDSASQNGPIRATRRPGGETPVGMCTSEGRRPWRSGRASHVILERGTFGGGVLSDHQTDDSKEKLQPLGLLLPIWAPGVLVHGCHWGGICLLPEGRVSMGRMRISLDFNATHGVPAPTQRGGQAMCIRHPRPCGLRSLDPKATVCLKCTSVKA